VIELREPGTKLRQLLCREALDAFFKIFKLAHGSIRGPIGTRRPSSFGLVLRGFLLVPQGAPEDLADVGLGQLGPELDVLRALVAGELVLAERQNLLGRERRILFCLRRASLLN
jgi:hypothetical protein